MSPESLYEAAKRYVEEGISVIPIKEGKKVPAVRWKEYQERLPRDEELQHWFGNGRRHNIALVCGSVSRNLTVLDFDNQEAYERWEAQNQELAASTRRVKTKRGVHVYLRTKESVPSRTLKDVEVKGDGGCVLAPPSIHPSGPAYEVIGEVREIRELDSLDEAGLGEEGGEGGTEGGDEEGRRRFRESVQDFLEHGAAKGERDKRAFEAACYLRDEGCSEDEATRRIAEALAKSSPDRDPSEWAREKVRSAYSHPRAGRNKREESLDPSKQLYCTAVDLIHEVSSIEWLWKEWIPRGLLSMLAADPGVGKSYVALSIAKSIICGDNWPDGSSGPRGGKVLWVDTEASQAILAERIQVLQIPRNGLLLPGNDPLADLVLSNPEALARLGGILEEARPDLVVVDSLRGAHREDENSSTMAGVLAEVAELARRRNAGVLFIHHLRKRGALETGPVLLERIRGSSAIVAAMRVVMVLECLNVGSPASLRLRCLKSNIGKLPHPLSVSIGEEGPIFGRAREEVAKKSKLEEAVEFLGGILGEGSARQQDIMERAEEKGISRSTLHRAKKELNITSQKEGKEWCWSLPQAPPE